MLKLSAHLLISKWSRSIGGKCHICRRSFHSAELIAVFFLSVNVSRVLWGIVAYCDVLLRWQQCGASTTDSLLWGRFYITTWWEARWPMHYSAGGATKWTSPTNRCVGVGWKCICDGLLLLASTVSDDVLSCVGNGSGWKKWNKSHL